MGVLIINSKISDILYSVDSFGVMNGIVVRREDGELLNCTNLNGIEKVGVCFRSLISKRLYYLRVYHQSSGKIVKRLKLIKNQDANLFKNRLVVFLHVFYYRLIFSNTTIESLEYCLKSKKIVCRYGDGRYINLLKN